MSDFYAEMVEVADELLVEFGEPAVLRQVTITAPNPAEPWNAVGTTVDVPTTAVWLDEVTDYRDGELVGKSKQTVLLTPITPAVPTLKDVLVRAGSEIWSILSAEPVRPGSTTVLYELSVVRSG